MILTLLFPSVSLAWQGKVVGVSDGDTVTVMHEGRGEKIRLYGIDCPEKHQDFGTKAKKCTSSMAYDKLVEVESVTQDRYGRSVALVKVNGQSLNEELLKAGLAWVLIRHCDKPLCNEWLKYEEQTRQRKSGLWSMPNPMPPWEFRRAKKR
jgi:endonuclease YncB( thermonuclease family)